MKGIWKNIKDFEIYQVSNLGNVRRYNKANEYDKRIKKYTYLKFQTTKRGYLQVSLYKNGKQYRKTIHRLVAETFIPNYNNYSQVNHINEIKSDNKVENLEWCDNWYNSHFGNHIENARIGHFKKINQYDLNNNFIKQWNSIIEASNTLKIDTSSISKVCKNKRKTAGGYVWKYERM